MDQQQTTQGMRKITMGLGAAIKQLIKVETSLRQGTHALPDAALVERDMIVLALNQIDLDLGFDCDGDGLVDIPDTVDIFQVSARTSCCRIQSKDGSKSPALPRPVAPSDATAPPTESKVVQDWMGPSEGNPVVLAPDKPKPPSSRGKTRAAPSNPDTPPTEKKGLFGLFGGKKKKEPK